MSFAMSFIGIPDALSEFVLSFSENPIIILLIINLLLLLIGTVMDVAPAILIFTPIFMPIAMDLGVDPVHFCMFFFLTLCICMFNGCITSYINLYSYFYANCNGSRSRPCSFWYVFHIKLMYWYDYTSCRNRLIRWFQCWKCKNRAFN